jgi:hypothetical protein
VEDGLKTRQEGGESFSLSDWRELRVIRVRKKNFRCERLDGRMSGTEGGAMSSASAEPEIPPLSAAQRRALGYVEGYLELGLAEEAAEEFSKIDPTLLSSVEAKETKLHVLTARKDWPGLEAAARSFTPAHPDRLQGWISLAIAVRRTVDIEAARKILSAVDGAFGGSSGLFNYNLACYCCLTGGSEEAMRRLQVAFRLDSVFRELAAEDEDLRCLRDAIAALG